VRSVLAWLGGAVFVASLGWCFYFYAVVLAAPAQAATGSAIAVVFFDIALFSLFAVHHSLLARTGMKRLVMRLVPASSERTLYVWIASALLIAVCWLWRPLAGTAYDVPSPWRWVFYVAQLIGLVLTWRGAAVIDVLELAGIRQSRGDTRVAEFRVIGPFRFVRHPIYLGWMLMVFAAPTMTMSRLVFAGVSSVYLILAIPWEERSLIDAFGDRYRTYQSTVRWRVMPGIW
jgi:methanethiol S-methyltransferase